MMVGSITRSFRPPTITRCSILSRRTHFEDAGFEVEVIPNQGPGAAMMRIEALRRVFPRCWFNEATSEAGREALGFITNAGTKRVILAWGRNMIGRAMLPTLSA
jgi:phage terminase large subunit